MKQDTYFLVYFFPELIHGSLIQNGFYKLFVPDHNLYLMLHFW